MSIALRQCDSTEHIAYIERVRVQTSGVSEQKFGAPLQPLEKLVASAPELRAIDGMRVFWRQFDAPRVRKRKDAAGGAVIHSNKKKEKIAHA